MQNIDDEINFETDEELDEVFGALAAGRPVPQRTSAQIEFARRLAKAKPVTAEQVAQGAANYWARRGLTGG